MESFEKELENLIKDYRIGSELDIPDEAVAKYLVDSLEALRVTVQGMEIHQI